MMTIRFVQADDWVALYVNGKIVHQGHSVPTHIWLTLMGAEAIWLDEIKNGQEILEEDMSFPETWRELEARYGI